MAGIDPNLRLAVLGPGNLGGALVRGWVEAGVLSGSHIRFYTPNEIKAAALTRDTGAVAAATPAQAVAEADAVLVSVKPHLVVPGLAAIREALPAGCAIISVAAGVRLAAMEEALPAGASVLRALPNTPALVGEAATAFCRGAHATDSHASLVQALFEAVGRCVEVASESQMDAVVGAAASASAYFYLILEALTDGGVRAGLPRQTAATLVAQTALGSARMVLETGQHPAVLKDAVTTPGGTTMAALEVLEKAGIRGTLIEAVLAAQNRSRELGAPPAVTAATTGAKPR